MNNLFEIMQAPGANNNLYVVIQGYRTAAGGMAPGSKIVTTAISRKLAIELATEYNQVGLPKRK